MIIATALLVAVFAGLMPQQSVAQELPASVEQQLIDLYVPVVYPRLQSQACAPTPDGGEPYLPLPVELVLGNDEVVLRDANDRSAIASGLTAQELATYDADTYLDFPGNARRPGCTFETDERRFTAELGLEPTAYARIIIDTENDRMIVQYWFFWYYNDWNNIHEADWEGIVLYWDSISTVEEALQAPPDRLGYAQHGGGELANWDDRKVTIENGTHPVAYPAAGAHASFYTANVYLGWGENGSGFGCDITSTPNARVEVKAVLIPEEIDPNGEFAWVLYPGRWGEQQPSHFNGVNGPGFNSRWADPWGATDRWRTSSIVVPSVGSIGSSMTDFFCTVTHYGSQLLIIPVAHPWLLVPMIVLILGGLVLLYLGARHYFRRAIALYRSEWKTFIGIGAVAIPIGILMNIFQRWVIARDPISYLIRWFDDTAGARLTAVLALGGIQQLAMFLIISPAVIQAVKDIENGVKPGVRRSYKLGLENFRAIAVALIIVWVLVGIPLLAVITFPIAIWLLIRWQFTSQIIVFDCDPHPVKALRLSTRLVKDHWWRTMTSILMFDLLGIMPGVVVGFALLALGGTAVGFANGVSSVFYALIVPLSVIALTLLYLDRKRGLGADTGLVMDLAPERNGYELPNPAGD